MMEPDRVGALSPEQYPSLRVRRSVGVTLASRAVGSFRTGPAARQSPMLGDMAIQRMDNVAVVDIHDTVARPRAHGAELLGEVARYENMFLLCYLRGPAGIIIALAEQIG
jgi:hypothetical protein